MGFNTFDKMLANNTEEEGLLKTRRWPQTYHNCRKCLILRHQSVGFCPKHGIFHKCLALCPPQLSIGQQCRGAAPHITVPSAHPVEQGQPDFFHAEIETFITIDEILAAVGIIETKP